MPEKKKKVAKLGFKIHVEFTGHLPKPELEQFMQSLASVLNNHMENGGNGGP